MSIQDMKDDIMSHCIKTGRSTQSIIIALAIISDEDLKIAYPKYMKLKLIKLN